ncbi:hypothetical protein HPP92_011229 [Vanilla planifolia]|uniref:Uncharacterized protein n=1 Tax=Vanilla planifolia TaxID=51239 RepID=A0A835V487_VANPL|nr:hypothetical protein HPP92_011229 [Vanilla planifolia]
MQATVAGAAAGEVMEAEVEVEVAAVAGEVMEAEAEVEVAVVVATAGEVMEAAVAMEDTEGSCFRSLAGVPHSVQRVISFRAPVCVT